MNDPPPDDAPISPLDARSSAQDLHDQQQKAKRTNPLTDLIETEKAFVDLLTGIIRKVAAAWSRSNLPPPELDTMFRSIEGVYRANRSLHSKLRDVGANPKALGDLLMRWVEDLDTPYSTYCGNYLYGFDIWSPVQSNTRLEEVLTTFSESMPPPSSSPTDLSIWTLDALFRLPRVRLKYYRKLYSRLIKGTSPGRSDHRLLLGALDTLDRLLGTIASRENMLVGHDTENVRHLQSVSVLPTSPPPPFVSEASADRNEIRASPHLQPSSNAAREDSQGSAPGSDSSSWRDSSNYDSARQSRATAITTLSRSSNSTLSMPISHLERRLLTHNTLDIFTMKPKVVKLHMTPPYLTFTREMRLSADVVIQFTPRATGQPVVHSHAHIFLLSDLFLICDRMSPEELTSYHADGADMWLAYPPLAGKVLRVSEVEGQDKAVEVAIMRKEFLVIELESRDMRKKFMADVKECIEFSGTLPPPSKQAPPPVPSINYNQHYSASGPPEWDYTHAPAGPSVQTGSMRASHTTGEWPMGVGSSVDSAFASGSNTSSPDIPSHVMLTPDSGNAFTNGSNPNMHSQLPSIRTSASHQPHTNTQATYGPLLGMPSTRSASYVPESAGPMNGIGQRHSPLSTTGPPVSRSRMPTQDWRFSPEQRQLPLPTYGGGVAASALSPVESGSGGLRPYDHMYQSQMPSALQTSRASHYSFVDSGSPEDETHAPTGPVTSVISAQMKCKVFLQQQHAQWKSLGSGSLKLYHQKPTNVKQLVVTVGNKVLISTIVLTDGVERVGKTGVAIELSDKGQRTGIVYMIQLRNEQSAQGLFQSLLAGSDRES